ncbi:MAG TPA: UDP-N-acetylmuramate--L-alanine ligase [Bacteroidales bacterium]|nr:UDP-N-acetylmuramate--L-alanine ligase [Bacteroidales bacterium]
MTDLPSIKKIYFLGIGGIGMSALARYFKYQGVEVSGYDKTKTPLTEELIKEGISVHYEEDISALAADIDLVVYTPAVPKEHKEYLYFIKNNFPIKKRSEVLGLITKDRYTIAVSGTHGKTTITSMIAHILKESKKDVISFIGGISKNYKSNLILSKENKIAVVEADEFDRSFLQLHPDIAIISSMDADHLDIYGNQNYLIDSFRMFANQTRKNGKIFFKKGLALNNLTAVAHTYSAFENADYSAKDVQIKKGYFYFSISGPEGFNLAVKLGVPGLHNVENAIVASAVALNMGVKPNEIKKALASYTGVVRRFDYRIQKEKLIYIDDYAHHPQEIKACIQAARELYPEKKITGVFQPHLFSRTRDLIQGFAESLALLDELILLDIYPAREKPIEGVTSQMLCEKINMKNKMVCKKENLVEELIKRKLDVLITIGAGDIDQLVLPIEKSLLNMLKISQ